MNKNIVMRIPTSEEWNKMMDICKEDDSLTHWEDMLSWVDDKKKFPDEHSSYRASCGCDSPRFWDFHNASNRISNLGFRPAFENLTIDAIEGEMVVVGTLYMNGNPVKVPIIPTVDGDIEDYIPEAKLEIREPLDDPQYQVKAIKIGDVYIADRVLLKNIRYEDILCSIGDRYVVLISELAIRDTQVYIGSKEDYEKEYDETTDLWADRYGVPLFLGIYSGDREYIKDKISKEEGIDKNFIELIPVNE